MDPHSPRQSSFTSDTLPATPPASPSLDSGSPVRTVSPPPNPPQNGPGKKLRIALMAVLICLGLGLLSSWFVWLRKTDGNTSQPKVKVGVMMAFSGGSSSMGYGAMKGIQLAKKQLGANNIDIVQMDSKCDAKTAAAAIKRLIAQNVVAIIGEGCSSATVAALPAANNSKTLLISPSASTPTLSIPNDYFFRVVPPDTLQGSFMARAIYNKGIRNVAVFYTNEPYGSGMNNVFREQFQALGGKVVATATAEPDLIDLQSQIQTLKSANPQAIFIAPNSVVSATAVVKLVREAGMDVPLFGADIMYDTTIIQNGGVAAEGLTISSFPTGTKSFKQALVNEYKKTEQLYAAPQAYDIIHILQLAVERGAITGEQLKNTLPGIHIQGVSGKISFDQNGEISDKQYKYDLFQIKDGTFTLVE